MKSAAAQLLACVIKRVFRSRRRKGENERINRVSDVAIMMEFPRLFPMLTSMLQAATENHSQYTFAVSSISPVLIRFSYYSNVSTVNRKHQMKYFSIYYSHIFHLLII